MRLWPPGARGPVNAELCLPKGAELLVCLGDMRRTEPSGVEWPASSRSPRNGRGVEGADLRSLTEDLLGLAAAQAFGGAEAVVSTLAAQLTTEPISAPSGRPLQTDS